MKNIIVSFLFGILITALIGSNLEKQQPIINHFTVTHIIDTVYKTDTILKIEYIKDTIKEEKVSSPVRLKIPKYVESFVDSNLIYAKMLQDSFGIDMLFALTQPAFESGWGTSYLAKNNRNLWGIKKCKGYKNDGKWTKFDNIKQGWLKYAELINKYKNNKTSFNDILYEISGSPYTGKKGNRDAALAYANKLLKTSKMIESYLKSKY